MIIIDSDLFQILQNKELENKIYGLIRSSQYDIVCHDGFTIKGLYKDNPYQKWCFSYNKFLKRIEMSVYNYQTGEMVYHATSAYSDKIFPFTLFVNKGIISYTAEDVEDDTI